MRRAIILAAVLTTPNLALAQGALFRGPFLNDVTMDAVTVIWESPTPTTGVIGYGINSPSENTVSSGTPSTYHAVRLTGLAALGHEVSEGRTDYGGAQLVMKLPRGYAAGSDSRKDGLAIGR